MMHACASAAKLRGGGPILNGGSEAVDKRGTPPPRTVIASPSQPSGWERSHNWDDNISGFLDQAAGRSRTPSGTTPSRARRQSAISSLRARATTNVLRVDG